MVLTLRPKIIPHSKQTTFDIDTYVDSDWAGCATSRRSTSGMALYFLGTLITSQSRTQATVALSSGEAELYAIGLGVSESLFIRSLLLESQLSKNVNIRIHTDSTAGKSMATRFGTSKKTKHVQLRFLFIQELVASGVVSQESVWYFESIRCDDKVHHKGSTSKTSHVTWDHLSLWQSSLTSRCGAARVYKKIVSHFIRTHLRMYARIFHSTPRNCLKYFG